MQLSILLIAALASVAIALPQHNLKVKRLQSESNKLVARAPAEEKVHSIVARADSKCFIPEGCPFISDGGSISVTGGAAFTLSGSVSFFSGGSLQWGGLAQFGYTSVSGWKNNFLGASKDFAIFVNGFAGLVAAFQSSVITWASAVVAVTKFAIDFSVFFGLLVTYKAFGSFESGKAIFQVYFIDVFKIFQSFFQVILARYGAFIFKITEIFGQFETAIKVIFKFCSTIGLGSLSLLKSASIDFTLFTKVGFTLESWIGTSISARHLGVEMF